MTEPGETKNQATAPATVNSSSSSNQKLRRPKEKQASRVVDEDEDTEPLVQATASSNVKSQEQIIPNNAEVNLDSNVNVIKRGLQPKEPKARPTAEDLHSIQEPDWSSPAKLPFAPQEDDMDSDEGEDCKITTRKKNKATASRKRKARDDDAVSKVEIPAPKKGKGETGAALKTPACTKLIKNFETPLPASPLHAARVTQAKTLSSQGTSSSTSIPTTKSVPAPVMSKAEIRKAATNKAAATQAANKKAKEDQDKVKRQSQRFRGHFTALSRPTSMSPEAASQLEKRLATSAQPPKGCVQDKSTAKNKLKRTKKPVTGRHHAQFRRVLGRLSGSSLVVHSDITHFRHALALDECRVKFLPKHVEEFCIAEHSQEYVWFAGTHSDIGGGNKANPTLDRGGEPLKWMMEEAHEKGLSVQLHDVKIGIPHAKVTESMGVSSLMGFFYMILEYAPFLCWKEHLSNGETRSRWWFHNKRAREVLPYQSIHWTVKASLNQGENKPNTANKTYSPKAVLLDGQLTEEEKKKGIQKTIEWGKLPMGYQTERKPACMDDYQFTRMVDILKDECGHADKVWFERLQKHVLVDNPGKPDAIWVYGGPQFLDRLFKTYPDQQDTAKIARAIDMILPRTILLLKSWAEDNINSNPSKPTTWARIKGWLGLSSKDVDEPNSVDAQWNWDRIPKEARSMALAREVTNILSDVMETRTFTQIIHDASETIAYGIAAMFDQLTGGFGARIESAAPWEKEKTGAF
ncbi:positive histone H3-K79 methylation, partial [Rhizoctonia solani]